jgi:hypothetical protein
MTNSYKLDFFEDIGGSPELNVDGSVTPKEFFIRPVGKQVFSLSGLGVLMLTTNKVDDIEEFGNLPALANGISLVLQKDGVDVESNFINTNADLLGMFSRGDFRVFDNPMQILNTELDIPEGSLILSARKGDAIKLFINDDLSSLEKLRLSVQYFVRGDA